MGTGQKDKILVRVGKGINACLEEAYPQIWPP